MVTNEDSNPRLTATEIRKRWDARRESIPPMRDSIIDEYTRFVIDYTIGISRKLQWFPIETAPKDGTFIDIVVRRWSNILDEYIMARHINARYCGKLEGAASDGFWTYDGMLSNKPETHKILYWMPAPELPNLVGGEAINENHIRSYEKETVKWKQK